MAERRYSETEVAEIFRRASEAQQQGGRVPLASGEGMTLGALQEIGRDVGLPPELVERAAREIDRTGEPATRGFLGLPVGVSRTVVLSRKLTDADWEALVVDLRDTFDARGRLRDDGAFRQWTNGNLQALLEPIGNAHRLRLRTTHGAARAWMMGGVAILGVAVVSVLAALSGDVPRDDLLSRVGSMLALGAGMFAAGAIRLPRWASIRRRQMAEIAERAASRTEETRG